MPIHQAADQDRRGADHIAWLESGYNVSSWSWTSRRPDGLSGALAGRPVRRLVVCHWPMRGPVFG